jgi:hypothetical protein
MRFGGENMARPLNQRIILDVLVCSLAYLLLLVLVLAGIGLMIFMFTHQYQIEAHFTVLEWMVGVWPLLAAAGVAWMWGNVVMVWVLVKEK